MRDILLTILILAAVPGTFAQKTASDTVSTKEELNARCAAYFAQSVAQKDYTGHSFVLKPGSITQSKAAQDNPQFTEIIIKNYSPVLKKGEVLYRVVEVKKNIIYPKSNYRMENFNLLLFDSQLKPQFSSISYASDTASNFVFVGVYQDEYLEFSGANGKHFYVAPPNTNPDPSANYLEMRSKKMCFFEIPENQAGLSIDEIHLPLQYKYNWCSEAYGVKSNTDH